MKGKIERELKQFIPAAFTFAGIFLLLRAYEFVLLQGRTDESLRIAYLEFGSLGYDLIFSFSLITAVLIIHLIISIIRPRIAYVISSIVFTMLILLDVCTIQYFSTTLVPLSADFFGYSGSEIITTIVSSGGLHWSTVTPVIVLIPLVLMGLSELKRSKMLQRLSFSTVLAGVALFVIACFLPKSPSQERFQSDSDYYIATNKTHFFLTQAVGYASERISKKARIQPKGYPLLRAVEYNDKLGQFLNRSDQPPNFVFIIVEGLGRDFTGPDAHYGGFTPYLDSISAQSLYWKNFLSNAGRTFGALPSILGSLPYGHEGFMSYGNEMPDHQTLVSLLKPYGYISNFFYGGNPNFDNQDLFIEYQGFDKAIDQTKFPASYRSEGLSSWGYPDRSLFSFAAKQLQEPGKPRIDVYLTLSTHEPFIAPDSAFLDVFKSTLKDLPWDTEKRSVANRNQGIFSCLLYTDDAIRRLITSYSKRADFNNTIFVIVGDHRLIPLPPDNRLGRFHVPLIIYSPLVKKPVAFESVALHSDIPATILGYMSRNYGFQFPVEMPFISGPLTMDSVFGSNLDIALIRNKNSTSDYIDGQYLLSEGKLYMIEKGLELTPISNDPIQQNLNAKLKAFKTNTVYVCENNKLDKKTRSSPLQQFRLTKFESSLINDYHISSYTADQQFEEARKIVFEKKYPEGRAILKDLLNNSPNYHDARILLARTYGWAGTYDSAVIYLQQTIDRAPAYTDAYCALGDVEHWRGNADKSLEAIQRGLLSDPSDEELLVRKARALMKLNRKAEAQNILTDILTDAPRLELAVALMDQLKTPE